MTYEFHAIGFTDLAISASMVGVTFLVNYLLKLFIGRDILWGLIRCFVQLVLIGYALTYIFGLDSWPAVYGVVLLMVIIAGMNAGKRVPGGSARTVVVAFTAVLAGSGLAIIICMQLVLRIDPWYDPYYTIPLSGMIIAAAMDGVTLGMLAFQRMIRDRREEVEAALALGATSWIASRPLVREALRNAMLPLINGMMVAGIVRIPGMMSGQIIAGNAPTEAAMYQIMVYYLLAGAVAVASIVGVISYARGFFTPAHQLRPVLVT
jgi:putative ABC transport system permease protein